MWASLSDEELVQRSELIVFGRWTGQAAWPRAGAAATLALGKVAVEEVLKGAPGTKQAQVVVPGAGALKSGNDIHFRVGDRGLWLLRRYEAEPDAGVFLADHPQRFVPAAAGAAQIQALRALLGKR